MSLIVLNDVFHFTRLIEPKDSGLGLSAARLLMALIIATVGTKWLIDPIDQISPVPSPCGVNGNTMAREPL